MNKSSLAQAHFPIHQHGTKGRPLMHGFSFRQVPFASVFPHTCIQRKLLWLVLFNCMCLATVSAQTQLRYRFKPEDKLVYDVKINAIVGDTREIREGTLKLEISDTTDQQTTLKAAGSLNVRRQTRDGNPVFTIPNFQFGPPVGDHVNIRTSPFSISRSGEITEIEVQTALPYMLGDFEQLVLDELPVKSSEKNWSREREVTIFQQARNSPFPRGFRPRGFGRPPGFGPPGFDDDDNGRDRRSAHEKVTWEVISNEDAALQIQKSYLLVTDDKVDGKPRRKMAGEGELSFDPAKGCWKSGLMKYQVEINDENVSATIPVTVSFRLLTSAEAAKREKEAAEAKKKADSAAAKAAEAAKPKPITADERKELLEDLRSSNDQIVQKAGDRLARVPDPSKPDTEIAAALAESATRLNGFPRAAVAKALAIWATPAQEKVLIELLSTNDFMVRQPALAGLGKMKSSRSAKVLAKALGELASRSDASKALKAMGPALAEPEVIPLLKHSDVFTRGEAAKILQEIGTKKSLPALKDFLASGQSFAEQAAKPAIDAIQLRESLKD